jgi:hypothetical protein
MNSATATHLRFALPDDIPWHQSIGLLLDGVQVEDLLKRLYQWADAPTVKVLYLGSRFAALKQVSPCLVRIESADDSILAQFLACVDQQWGYLLVSDKPWEQLAAHLRWLMSVEHPSGQEILLRIACPAVADALFESADPALFGPVQRIVTADLAKGGWHQYNRPDEMLTLDHSKPYRLSEEQWLRLDNASTRKTVTELSQHMTLYFPDYYADLTEKERHEHFQALVHRAAGHGFQSKKELYLYCNAHGFVGPQALEDPTFAPFLEPHPTDEYSTWRAEGLASQTQTRSQP